MIDQIQLLEAIKQRTAGHCDGACDGHIGEINVVHVTGNARNCVGTWNCVWAYCEKALQEDRAAGFTVKILPVDL